jgi:uncharacterized phage protein (TIGR02220 family)
MSAVKDNNFIAIQGWMRTKLNLKGNELLIYALIYGFSQDGESRFKGSRKYIADWCGCSLDTVDRSLRSLVDKGLLAKYPCTDDYGSRLVAYAAIQPTAAATPTPAATQSPAAAQSPAQAPSASTTNAAQEQSQTPITEPQPLLEEPQAPARPKEPDLTEEVVAYLNQRAYTHYRATTASTRRLIKARLKEGFTVDEFKLVIDKKCAEWLNNRDMAQYLRPETLFGPKFESYLNARPSTQAHTNTAAIAQDTDGHVAECTRENGWF